MATRGKLHDVTVTHDAASDIGRHWVAINKFLESNDQSHLEPFVGLGLRDTRKRFWPFETRPNWGMRATNCATASVPEGGGAQSVADSNDSYIPLRTNRGIVIIRK
jgi:hypothetical protein